MRFSDASLPPTPASPRGGRVLCKQPFVDMIAHRDVARFHAPERTACLEHAKNAANKSIFSMSFKLILDPAD